jgi:aspartyl-tRNA(Asn)/glutamyl-tRNA(Gln) amidotransferase subunit C
MKISLKEVQHIAHLARLELSKEELEKYSRQLSDILSYMDKLNELDTSNIEPTSHVIPLKNVFREDKAQITLSVDEALKNAPEVAKVTPPSIPPLTLRGGKGTANFFKVPRIIE